MRTSRYKVVLLGVLIVLLVGCSGAESPTATTIADSATPSSESSIIPLRIGILATIDSLPIQVADAGGLFKEQGIDVEVTTFASAIAREAAIQAGQEDGELNDLISTAILNKAGTEVRIVRTAVETNSARPVFQILASPGSHIGDPSALKGKSIAISNNTIVDFMTSQLLGRNGLTNQDVSLQAVADISLRLQMLSDSKVDAAVLPEPLATLAISRGARSVIADTGTDIGPTNTLVFKASVIRDHGESVRRFLAAYDKAVVKINGNFDDYRQLLVDRKILNVQVQTTFVAMPFPAPSLPTSKEVEQFSNWLVAKGIISTPLDYGSTVDTTFLTK